MVRKPGFEPGTYRLGGDCSIQLSYKRMEGHKISVAHSTR